MRKNLSASCDILSYARGQAAFCGRAPGSTRFPMNVEAILRSKGREVATIRPHETIAAAVTALREHNVGALVVSEDGETVDGIISERDLVHGLGDHGGALLSLPVARVMTERVATCDPADSVADLMAEMTNRRIRHFPVVARRPALRHRQHRRSGQEPARRDRIRGPLAALLHRWRLTAARRLRPQATRGRDGFPRLLIGRSRGRIPTGSPIDCSDTKTSRAPAS